MKRILQFLSVSFFVFSLVACDEWSTVVVDTTLSKTITTEVENPESPSQSLKSTVSFPFYEEDTINLGDNNDLEEYLDQIKEIDIYSATCSLNGIHDGEVINELTITAIDAGFSVTLTDINKNNNAITLEISGENLKALGDYLLQYETLPINISGTSSFAPMTLSVSLDFETAIKASVLKSM
jgi:hypothetical protein